MNEYDRARLAMARDALIELKRTAGRWAEMVWLAQSVSKADPDWWKRGC